IALFEFGENDQRLNVRTKIEKIFRRDLAGHDRSMNIVSAEKFEEPPQLPDTQPFDDVSVFGNRRIGFVGKRRRDDFLYAAFACGGSENSWVNAVARDDSENLRRLQIVDDVKSDDDGGRGVASALSARKPEWRRVAPASGLLSSPLARWRQLSQPPRCRSFRIPAPCRSKLKPRLL